MPRSMHMHMQRILHSACASANENCFLSTETGLSGCHHVLHHVLVHPVVEYMHAMGNQGQPAACRQAQTSLSTAGRGMRQPGRQVSIVSSVGRLSFHTSRAEGAMLALRITGCRAGGGLGSQLYQQIAHASIKVLDTSAGLCTQQCDAQIWKSWLGACQPWICLPPTQTPRCRGFLFQMPLAWQRRCTRVHVGAETPGTCIVTRLVFSAHCVTRRSGRSFVCMPSTVMYTHVQWISWTCQSLKYCCQQHSALTDSYRHMQKCHPVQLLQAWSSKIAAAASSTFVVLTTCHTQHETRKVFVPVGCVLRCCEPLL